MVGESAQAITEKYWDKYQKSSFYVTMFNHATDGLDDDKKRFVEVVWEQAFTHGCLDGLLHEIGGRE